LVLGYMRNDRAAEEATDAVREAGAERVLVRGNVASERVVSELASHGPYDVVVHNAATGVIRAALETEDKHWDWTLSANARAFLSLARATAPDMPAGSTIVAVSSLGSTRVLENYVLVGTSKAALESLVRYLAVELAPRGIRVNAVSAGVVETGALEHFPNREEMLSHGLARTPAGRLVEPGDVAAAGCWLCSPRAAMVSGPGLGAHGGVPPHRVRRGAAAPLRVLAAGPARDVRRGGGGRTAPAGAAAGGAAAVSPRHTPLSRSSASSSSSSRITSGGVADISEPPGPAG